jgi:RNA polymerase sigma factor (TIGR02999 family)
MSELTQILVAIEQGNEHATKRLLPLVYDELRKLAAQKLALEKPGQTLQATALVHEAYLRLVGPNDIQRWDCSGHFFAAAAEAMRRILIDHARNNRRLRRGGSHKRLSLDLDSIHQEEASPDDLIDLDAAIEKLSQLDDQAAALVKLRVFAGLTIRQAALALGISRRTAERDWTFARTWLYGQVQQGEESS